MPVAGGRPSAVRAAREHSRLEEIAHVGSRDGAAEKRLGAPVVAVVVAVSRGALGSRSDLYLAGRVSRICGGPAWDVGLYQLHQLGADLRTVLGCPHHRARELSDLSHRPRVLALGVQHDLLRGWQCRRGQFGCAAHGPAAQSEADGFEYLPDDLLPAGNPAGGRGRSRLQADPFPGNRTRQLGTHQGRRSVRHHPGHVQPGRLAQ